MNKKTLTIIAVIIAVLGLYTYSLYLNKNASPSENIDHSAMGHSNSYPTATSETSTGTDQATETPSAVSVNVGVGNTKTFTVVANNFTFSPASMSVKKGDKVRIIFKNIQGTHDLKIDELGVDTGIIGSNQERTVEFTADKVGTFEYYCSVGSHRAMGMKGTITVSE